MCGNSAAGQAETLHCEVGEEGRVGLLEIGQ